MKTLSVKSNFLEYTQTMISQIDLLQDSKQANNVCFEEKGISTCRVHAAELKDASTQTYSSMFDIFFL
jgi:hypothetical protein